jgi:Big-like domain-containing protein
VVRIRATVAVLAACLAVAALITGSSFARTDGTSPPALPDLRIFVPKDLISIGLDPGSGVRELRFTHITADVGPGPFEIDPHYNARTGVSTFSQTLFRPSGSGGWSRARSVPLATYGTWEPPSDYRYPLTSFTLDRLSPDGNIGAVVARSPKVDYCITGDTQVSGIPHTPGQTFIPVSDCGEPTLPLGWSVGWGDEYDQTDAGQPISLQGVPDGTYVLRATVDPQHVLHERTRANDVTDTTLRIAGDQVTVLSQQVVDLPPPRVRLVGARSGQDVYGSLPLRVSVRPAAGRAVQSVQFLIDGQPLGPKLAGPPYALPWTVAAKPGLHYLSARATDSEGVEGSAPVVRITVRRAATVHIVLLRWRTGVLTLRLRQPTGERIVAVVPTLSSSKPLSVTSGRLTVRCRRPRSIVLRLLRRSRQVGEVVLPLAARPAVAIVNPGRGETVSGIVPLAAQASDSIGVRSVEFLVDGKRLGPQLSKPPYRWHWDTRKLADGLHTLGARVVDALGHSATDRVALQVSNPAPSMTCFVLQQHVNAYGASPVATRPFPTVVPGETLLAFVSADGPQSSRQTATVSGGGVSWHLVTRANASPGDAEIWEATARQPTTVSPVSAGLRFGGYDESLSVIAMEGADGAGASAAASGTKGAPQLQLKTLSATSLVFAAGNDWDSATKRGLPTGWVLLDQWLDTQTGDTFWSQYTNQPTGAAGSRVTVSDSSPTGDHWNLAAVELINSGG